MATLALYAAGAAVGGAIGGTIVGGLTTAVFGGAIGGMLGGLIDQMYIFPAILGNGGDVQGQRLDDIGVQTASEGSVRKIAIGTTCRLAGTVIWMGDLVEKKHKEGGKGGGGAKATSYTYSVDVAIALCKGPIFSVSKVWADSKLIYDGTLDDSIADAMTIYLGSESQTADALLEAHLGAGEVPAYRGTAYLVFQKFQLQAFGNRFPNITVELAATETCTVGEALVTICEGATIDVTDVSGTFKGLVVGTLEAPARLAEPVMLAYDLAVQESSGELVFFPRTGATVIEVDEDDLGAAEDSSEPRPQLKLTLTGGYNLPSEVNVNYVDNDREEQRGSERAKRINATTTVVEGLDLPLVLTAGEAKNIAYRQLWAAWGSRAAAELLLPPKYSQVQEADILHVTFKGEQYCIRVRTVDRGANHLLHIRGIVEDLNTYTSTGSTTSGTVTSPDRYAPPALTTHLLDIAALTSAQVDQVGLYFAACATDPDAVWRGATLWVSDDDTNFVQIATIPVEATIGTTTSGLVAGTAGEWDLVNTVEVELLDGELESVAQADVEAGANHILIGNEILGFATATLVTGRTYELSDLLRGQRGTAAGTSGIGSRAVLLTPQQIQWKEFGVSAIGATKYFKFVPFGATTADVSSTSIVLAGNTLKPFAVSSLFGSRDGSDNIIVTWTMVSRAINGEPEEVDSNNYDVEFYAGSTLKKTVTIVDSTTATFTAAQQTEQGITLGETMNVKVYHLQEDVGRGAVAEATIA